MFEANSQDLRKKVCREKEIVLRLDGVLKLLSQLRASLIAANGLSEEKEMPLKFDRALKTLLQLRASLIVANGSSEKRKCPSNLTGY
jgi:hypothetical protein